MEERHVLCFDPSLEFLEGLSDLLRANGFVPHTASRLGEALEFAAVHRFAVIIMEYVVGESSAADAVRAFHRISPQSAVIMLTSQPDRRTGVDRRLNQVFEFLEKPVLPEVFLATMQRAWAFYVEKHSLYSEYENEDRMKYQMEWLLWKGRSHMQQRVEFTRQIVESIRHSLTQGMGMGALVTLGEMLEMDRQPLGDRYSVSRKTVDSLVTSARVLDSWLVFLADLAQAIDTRHRAEIMPGAAINGVIEKVVREMEGYAAIKCHRIEWDSSEFPHGILGKGEVMEMALRELILNALKYSPEGTTVSILKYRAGNHFTLAVVNEIQPMDGGITGIPPEMENQVFEPFFRVNHQFDERFGQGTSGLGVGLTLVQKALFEIGSKIFIHEITDFSARHQNKRIIAEMLFPVGHERADWSGSDGSMARLSA